MIKNEDSERYKEKLSIINMPRGEGFVAWFHVASVGEAMSILPLIDKCVQEQKINKTTHIFKYDYEIINVR